MATDEERAAIMAEYMAQVDHDNGDEDEEEEFEGDYFDDDDDDDDDGNDAFGNDDDDDDDDDDENEAAAGGNESNKEDDNYAILQGTLTFNDEGKLVYSGTWSMKQQKQSQEQATEVDDKQTIASTTTTTTTVINKSTDNATTTTTSTTTSKTKKKKTKFKLKSKRALKNGKTNNTNEVLFSLKDPLLAVKKPRSILFDGFFTTDETDTIEPYRKIKERDVELTFSKFVVVGGDDDNNGNGKSTSTSTTTKFLVQGRGNNDFGTFSIKGEYDISQLATAKEDDKNESISLTCHKRYGVEQQHVTRNRRRRRGQAHDSEDDYDFGDDGDEGADYNELIGLHEEAELSVEELRKRYYGGDDNNGEKGYTKPSVKKQKVAPQDDDDDDGCGF